MTISLIREALKRPYRPPPEIFVTLWGLVEADLVQRKKPVSVREKVAKAMDQFLKNYSGSTRFTDFCEAVLDWALRTKRVKGARIVLGRLWEMAAERGKTIAYDNAERNVLAKLAEEEAERTTRGRGLEDEGVV